MSLASGYWNQGRFSGFGQLNIARKAALKMPETSAINVSGILWPLGRSRPIPVLSASLGAFAANPDAEMGIFFATNVMHPIRSGYPGDFRWILRTI